MQGDVALPIGTPIDTIGVQGAAKAAPALADFFRQCPFQYAQPVAISQHLVLGIDGGDRVFQVEDGGQRGLHHQIRHPSRIGLADRVQRVDLQIEVDAVVFK
jgi:hypothetical protein